MYLMSGKCFLFDLDGTLIDSGEGITEGVAIAVEKYGLPPLDMETREKFIGPSLRESFCKYCGVDEETAEGMLAAYREYYGVEGLYKCKPYDGIEEVLSEIIKSGSKCYVATAKPTAYAEKMLEKWDMLKYFEKVSGASFDKSKIGKKEIIEEVLAYENHKEAVMIGDTCYDIEGAKQNEIASVAVTYGYGDLDALKAENPDYIVDTTEQLCDIIKRNFL